MKTILKGTAAALFGMTMSASAMAAEFGTKPIQIVNPFPPGDLEDVLGRLFADQLSEDLGVPAKLINKSGGGGINGVNEVVEAEPDGHTMGVFVIDFLTVLPALGEVPYTVSDLEPVGIYLTYPFILAVAAGAPYNTLAELADYAKTHDVSLGHFGVDLLPTITTFDMAKELGFEFSSNAAFDLVDCSTLLSGDADVATTVTQIVLPCLDSKEIKVIASYTDERISLFPEVGTLSEQTATDSLTLWNGVFVPKGTPADTKAKIEASILKVLASDEAKQIGNSSGAPLFWLNAAEAEARIAKDYEGAKDLLGIE